MSASNMEAGAQIWGKNTKDIYVDGFDRLLTQLSIRVADAYRAGFSVGMKEPRKLEGGDFLTLIRDELQSARKKHTKPIHSVTEGLAVIWEEFEEFKQEVFKQNHNHSKIDQLRELVQVAAMCMRTVEDCGLLEKT